MDNKVHIRWMIRRDMAEVLEIENASFDNPWSESDFVTALRQRNCIGMVAELDDRVVGFMIYELHKTRLHVLDFAVHPDWRRVGIGDQLASKLIRKLTKERRTRIIVYVRETNLSAQQFFRNAGFRAISVMREFYDDTDEDAYVMEYRFGVKAIPPTNRISNQCSH